MGLPTNPNGRLSGGIEWNDPAQWGAACPRHPARECARVGGAFYCGRCRAYYSAGGVLLGYEADEVETLTAGAGSSLAIAIKSGGADV